MRLENLSRREREIMESVYRRQRASCAEIRADLKDPPSYSAVRAMVAKLLEKGCLDYQQVGKKYVYSAVTPKSRIKNAVLKKTIRNFFDGSVGGAIVALLNDRGNDLDAEELEAIDELLAQRRATQSRNQTRSNMSK